MAEHEAVCIAENLWNGRRYYPGDVVPYQRGQPFPVCSGWIQREVGPEDPSGMANLPFAHSGRCTVNWNVQRPLVPDPGPVYSGFDALRGEPIIDQAATKRQAEAVWEINNRGRPVVTKELHWAQHLEHMRKFAPQQYQDYVDQHPEGFPRGAAPVADENPPAANQPTAAQPVGQVVEQVQDLEALLEQEAQAEAAGDAEKLAEIRQRIEANLK